MENWSGRNIKGYELSDRLGTGGFGAVYKANQSTVGREVAIKIILPHFANHPDFIRRFETEAQFIARLEHMHIVPLYDYWRDPDGAYLVMRWLRGGSLREALQDKPFNLEASALLLDQITAALAVAHRHNIIHRDLKPGNILLDEDGNAYLADFGIAKDVSRQGITQVDTIVGSPDYLAPEQANSEPVTPCTDIYSLGIVLYELLTGQHPFPNLNAIERLYKHLNEPLPEITNLPEALRGTVNRVIQKATAKNPAHRYPDAVAFATAFREAVQMHPTENVIETLTQREHDILSRIIAGHSNRQIADELVVTVGTVKWYVNQIFHKLNVRSRVQAIVRARELHLIVPNGDAKSLPTLVPITEDFQPENPYKGLRAFQSADNQDFFGREKLVQKLISRFGETAENSRFLAVVGPSGSGKSSLVKAGLIPAIWGGKLPGSEKWFVAEMLPGTHPLDELEIALMRVSTRQNTALQEQLARDERGLLRATQLILPDDDSQLVLVIDQFEEVFTLVEDERSRQHFLKILQTAIQEPRTRVRVVITLRADFYDRPLHYEQFGDLLPGRMETILPLGAEGLERAITKPAERTGIIFEPGLVSTIVGDVNYQPGALPLLQYALTELFEQRQGRTLTYEAYRAIGGTAGALAKRAEQIYSELSPEGQEAVEQMFLRLVTLAEGKEDTRRRVQQSELLALVADTDLMDELLDSFAQYRLLSLDNDPSTRSPTVEVAHEAILKEWERLRNWIHISRGEIKMQQQLAHLTEEWLNVHKDASYLVSGLRLEQFEKWVQNTRLALIPDERTYLEVSIAHREHENDLENERKQREMKLEKRTQTFLYGLVATLIVSLIVALGLSAFAFNSRAEAVISYTNAEAQRLGSEANRLLLTSGNPELIALLAIRSLKTQYSPQGDEALTGAVMLDYPYQGKADYTDQFNYDQPVLSLDGKYIVTRDDDDPKLAHLLDATTHKQLHQLIGHSNIYSFAFSPDGHYLLTSGQGGEVRLWDTQLGQELRHLDYAPPEVTVVLFSPDGKTFLTGANDNTARLWSVSTGQELRRFVGNSWVIGIGFSSDGKQIVTKSHDGTTRLWDIQPHPELPQFIGHSDTIEIATFSHDGKYVLTSSHDYTARLWDARTGQELRRFVGHTNGIAGVAFSPDDKFILTGSGDETARLWDTQTGKELRQFVGHTKGVTGVAFSPDGKTALTISFDATARLWDVQTGKLLHILFGHSNVMYYAATFSPDGKTALTGALDHTARLWDVQTGKQLNLFNVPDSRGVASAAFSPNGKTILLGGLDGPVWLLDAQTGEELRRFVGHSDSVYTVAFSPDGRYVLTGSNDKTARLWDVQTGMQLRRFTSQTYFVGGAQFSPDGRYIITGASDTVARLWDVDYHDTIHYLCSRLLRDFTDDERVQYSIKDQAPTCTTSDITPMTGP